MKPAAKISFSTLIAPALLLVVAVFIYIFSFFPYSIEKIYSGDWYPAIASTLRMITRWIPFSIGDLLYLFVFIWLIVKAIQLIRRIIRHEFTCSYLPRFVLKLLRIILWIYILFKLLWGLNYDRLGIAYQLHIEKTSYTKEEVTALTNQLIDKVNACRRLLPDTSLPSTSIDSIFREAYRAYRQASMTFHFLNYTNRSVKASLYTPISDYLGFTGYYNPFTGEAQLRTDIPNILVPYVACHEMAHQLGYASESEANFVGYLAASASKDIYVNYSVYLDLFSYAQAEEIALYGKEKDFRAFERMLADNRNRLDTLVKKDRRTIRAFFNKHKNNISPAVSNLYDQYLKMNKQLSGVNSYNEVIGWLIAYQKKYGKI